MGIKPGVRDNLTISQVASKIKLYSTIDAKRARAVRSATLNVPQAHAGGNQAEEDAVPASAGAPGEAGNVIACGYQPPHPLYVIST